MNEIERIIASLSPRGPSEELDRRIDALLTHAPAAPAARTWKPHAMWTAATACLCAVAFLLGRQSAMPQPHLTAANVAQSPEPAPQPTLMVDRVTNISLADNRLVNLFVRPTPREGMFGNGPIVVQVSPNR